MTEQRSVQRHAQVALAAAGVAELDQVVAIMQQAFDAQYGEAWTRSQCAGILPMPGVVMVLARAGDGSPAGFSLHRIVDRDAELLLLAVAPAHRRRGIGRLILDDFIERARRAGSSRVHLEVRDGNPAVEMYRQAGFATVGRRRNYYRGRTGSQFDALTLSKSI